MATSAISPDRDWFDANFRQVLGIAGTAGSGRPLSGAQVLAAIDKRYTRNVDQRTSRVTFTRNGEALQLMDDPAEIDPVAARIAASQLGGPLATLATIEADLCVPGDCEGDTGNALSTIRETIESLIEVSSRRDGAYRAQLLISQLVGRRPGPRGREFGLILCLRQRVAAGHSESPSVARETALSILDYAIGEIQSFESGMGARPGSRSRPMHDAVETLHRCAIHISDRVGEIRRTLAEHGIGQCELERAEITRCGEAPITIPDLFCALETLPRDWNRLIDGATPDSQAVIAATAEDLAGVVESLTPEDFAGLFNVGTEAERQLREAWARFGAYAKAILDDLGSALVSGASSAASGAAPSDEEALIEAPAEEQKPL